MNTKRVEINMNPKPTPNEIKKPFIRSSFFLKVADKMKMFITNLISGRAIPRIISVTLFS